MATKTNINTNDVTVTEIHRVFVMNCQSPWHRDLLAVVARHFRCVALKKHNALWLAGANSDKVQAARAMFTETLTNFRQAARDLTTANAALGFKTGRAEKVACYRTMLNALSAQLVRRLLPDATIEYASKRAEFVLELAA